MQHLIIALAVFTSVAEAQQKASFEETIANEMADNGRQNALAALKETFARTLTPDSMLIFLAALRTGQPMPQNEIDARTYKSVLKLMDHSVDKEVGSTPDTKVKSLV